MNYKVVSLLLTIPVVAPILTQVAETVTAKHEFKAALNPMRVGIVTGKINSNVYYRLQKALLDSKQFIIVDQSDGYSEVIKEQDNERNAKSRYSEVLAKSGQISGVSAFFIAHEACSTEKPLLSHSYSDCEQTLTLVDASTGIVLGMTQLYHVIGENNIEPFWDKTIETFIQEHKDAIIVNQPIIVDAPNKT